MRLRAHLPLLAAAFGATTTPASAWTILTVGPAGQYHSISEAVAAADADTNLSHLFEIHVAPGTYLNDFSDVTRPMRIMVDPAHAGQQVLLEATVPLPNEKGIILAEASLEVNGLTFKGAAIASSLGGNGAGIRDQITQPGAFLMVENSIFLDNQEGILTGPNTGETITISNSKFENNGNPDPAVFQHALYVGNAGSLTVSNSLFCGQLLGHNIKSRALATTVTNSQIYNGQADPGVCGAGSSSFGIDLPNSGVAIISGNQLFQGAASDNQNFIMVAYGEDGLSPGDNSLLLSNNSFISTAPHSIGVDDRTPNCVVPAQLVNNTFQNVTTPVNPPSCADPPEVPEPNTLWLLLSAIVGCAAAWRRSVAADRLPAAPKERGAPLCCTVYCPDGALRIAVADEGPGLPKDMAALLNRAASEPAPSPESKALGLWMIGHLIRRLGCRAEVEHPGVGTQVVVALAVVLKEALDVAA